MNTFADVQHDIRITLETIQILTKVDTEEAASRLTYGEAKKPSRDS
jgi:hypothetical protein